MRLACGRSSALWSGSVSTCHRRLRPLSLASEVAAGRKPRAMGRTPSQMSWVKVAAFSMLPVLVLIAAGEVGLRVWSYWFRTAYERYNLSSGRLELVPNIRYTTARGLEFRINSKGFLGPEFNDRKESGVYRIFAVGDSCTF